VHRFGSRNQIYSVGRRVGVSQASITHRSMFAEYSENWFAFLRRHVVQFHIFAPVGTVNVRSIRQRERVLREHVLLRKESRFLQFCDCDNVQSMGMGMSENHTFRELSPSIRGINHPDRERLHWQNISNSIRHLGAQCFASLECLQETKSGRGALHPDGRFRSRWH
jgi:hypothetical protein